jgi:Uri superfamily endonuclease
MVASTRGPISYQLVIEVRSRVRCSVGRLGVVDFAAGTYVYSGSARRNFEARLARHARATKRPRWHIDTLLAAPGVRIVKIVRSGRAECRLNQSVKGTVLVPGFGASDYSARPGPRPLGPPAAVQKTSSVFCARQGAGRISSTVGRQASSFR